jgi:catechol 2,3-dioxygenase-like lactoylglutathione lyase family enzyme
VTLIAIDHVQLAMPRGEEEVARRFYCGMLGLFEKPKPPELAKRGGCWFENGAVQVHLGVEADFRPAGKAHPAFKCADYDRLLSQVRSSGVEVVESTDIPSVRRCHVDDPFGNRLELISSDSTLIGIK